MAPPHAYHGRRGLSSSDRNHDGLDMALIFGLRMTRSCAPESRDTVWRRKRIAAPQMAMGMVLCCPLVARTGASHTNLERWDSADEWHTIALKIIH